MGVGVGVGGCLYIICVYLFQVDNYHFSVLKCPKAFLNFDLSSKNTLYYCLTVCRFEQTLLYSVPSMMGLCPFSPTLRCCQERERGRERESEREFVCVCVCV